MRLDDPAAQVQLQARAQATGDRLRRAMKALEQPGQLFWRNTHAAVDDAHLQVGVAPFHPDLNGRFGWAVLERIPNQVRQNLLDARALPVAGHWRVWQLNADALAVAWVQARQDAVQAFAQVAGRRPQREVAGLQTRGVQ